MKISYQHALDLIREARSDVEMQVCSTFGQALWNITPTELAVIHTATNKDFYFWTDEDQILNVFYEYYVGEDHKQPTTMLSWL